MVLPLYIDYEIDQLLNGSMVLSLSTHLYTVNLNKCEKLLAFKRNLIGPIKESRNMSYVIRLEIVYTQYGLNVGKSPYLVNPLSQMNHRECA